MKSRIIVAEIKKHTARNTHALAEVLGEAPWRTSARCCSLAKRGKIRCVCKGRPGRNGYPALWMMPNDQGQARREKI